MCKLFLYYGTSALVSECRAPQSNHRTFGLRPTMTQGARKGRSVSLALGDTFQPALDEPYLMVNHVIVLPLGIGSGRQERYDCGPRNRAISFYNPPANRLPIGRGHPATCLCLKALSSGVTYRGHLAVLGVAHTSKPATKLSIDGIKEILRVASILKLKRQTLRNWIIEGSLPCVCVGRRVLIPAPDFDAIFEEGYTGRAGEGRA